MVWGHFSPSSATSKCEWGSLDENGITLLLIFCLPGAFYIGIHLLLRDHVLQSGLEIRLWRISELAILSPGVKRRSSFHTSGVVAFSYQKLNFSLGPIRASVLIYPLALIKYLQ